MTFHCSNKLAKTRKKNPNLVVMKFPRASVFSGQTFIGDAMVYRSSISHSLPYIP